MAIQQDWETWMNNGWVDTLSPMIYTSSRSQFQSTVSRILRDTENKVLIYPGVAIFRLDSQEMLGHLEAIREKGGMGSTLFAFAHLDQSKQDALSGGPYKLKTSLTPHSKPVEALRDTAKAYQENFSRLIKRGEVVTLKANEVTTIQTTLESLTDLLQGWSNQPTTLASGLPTARALVNTLMEDTRRWVDRERRERPYRAQLFLDFSVRLDRLLSYCEKKAQLNQHFTARR